MKSLKFSLVYRKARNFQGIIPVKQVILSSFLVNIGRLLMLVAASIIQIMWMLMFVDDGS